MSTGQRIVYWAESFLGTPYDTDPLGKYVRDERIVADDAVDCMYLTFRAAELAMSASHTEAVERALDLRFTTKGRLEGERVINYDQRFEYGEDMIDSGKWGKEITAGLGAVTAIEGSRGRNKVDILSKDELIQLTEREDATPLRDGDVIFFIKDPKKRVVGEIVGHIGILTVKEKRPYLIHASGTKKGKSSNGGGEVKSLPLNEYLRQMRFIGARITRF